MRKSRVLLVALVVPIIAAGWCRARDTGRVDPATLQQDPSGPLLRVIILGDSQDLRVPAAREALANWNREFRRLGLRVHFDSGALRRDSVSDDILRGASGEARLGGGPSTMRLQSRLSDIPADIVIALSHTDLISFSVPWRPGSHGVAGIRRADVMPLSLPNTVRNVVAHELGHVIGLEHNTDSTTLMCGRPAPCRPAAFVSNVPRFFPLTAADEERLRQRWP